MEVAVAEAVLNEILFTSVQALRQVLFQIVVELDAQNRAGVALDERFAPALQIGAEIGVIENELVHHLAGGGTVQKDRGRGGESFEKVLELDHQDGFGFGQRHQIQRG